MFHFIEKSLKPRDSLQDPKGSLSCFVPCESIALGNNEVQKLMVGGNIKKTRGSYQEYVYLQQVFLVEMVVCFLGKTPN